MADGTPLPLRRWLPVDAAGRPAPVRAVILALHGFNDYSAAFAMPAALWQHDGIATYAYDQRGFGANPHPGRWPGIATLTGDFATALRRVRQRQPGVPVYALGESMGGAVVLDAAGDRRGGTAPAGIILAAPAVWSRRTMPLLDRVALWAAVRIIPAATFTGEGLGVLASDNLAMLRRLGRDPLFIKATRVDAIYGLVDLMDGALAAAPRDRLPTLLLYGAHDEVIPPRPMRLLDRALPGRAGGIQRLAYYRQGWHMLLRDLDYRMVAGDVASWIFDHRAPLPSGADRAAAAFRAGTAPEPPAPPAPERLKALAEPATAAAAPASGERPGTAN